MPIFKAGGTTVYIPTLQLIFGSKKDVYKSIQAQKEKKAAKEKAAKEAEEKAKADAAAAEAAPPPVDPAPPPAEAAAAEPAADPPADPAPEAPAAAVAEPEPPKLPTEDAGGLDIGGIDILGEVVEAPAPPVEEKKSTTGKGEWDDVKTEKLIQLRAKDKKIWSDVATELDETEMECVRKYSKIEEDVKIAAGHTYATEADLEWTEDAINTVVAMKKDGEKADFIGAFFNVPPKEMGKKIGEIMKAQNGSNKGNKSRQGSQASSKKAEDKEKGQTAEQKDDNKQAEDPDGEKQEGKAEDADAKTNKQTNGGKKKNKQQQKKADANGSSGNDAGESKPNGKENKQQNKPNNSTKQGLKFPCSDQTWIDEDAMSSYDPAGPPYARPTSTEPQIDASVPLKDQYNEIVSDGDVEYIKRLTCYYDYKKFEEVASRYFDLTGRHLSPDLLRAKLGATSFKDWAYG